MAKSLKEKDINVSREWVKLFLGIALALFGMGIITYSLVVEPEGASVVTTFGTILTFIGGIFGIDSHAKIRMHEQDMEFELKSRELDEKMQRFEKRLNIPEDKE